MFLLEQRPGPSVHLLNIYPSSMVALANPTGRGVVVTSTEAAVRRLSMSKRDEYLANADECERLAEMSQSPDERTAWLQMAQQWHRWTKRM